MLYILKNLLLIAIQVLTLILCPWVGFCNLIGISYAFPHGASAAGCLTVAYSLSGFICLLFYHSGFPYWLVSMILTVGVCVAYRCYHGDTTVQCRDVVYDPDGYDIQAQNEGTPEIHYHGDIHIDKAIFMHDSDFNNR